MSNTTENIINEALKYQKKCEINARAHFLHWENTSKWNNRIGIPIIILTTIVGATLFVTISQEDMLWLNILLGTLSLIAAILSSLQTTLGLADKSEKFKIAGLRYRAMVRQFDLFIFRYNDKIIESHNSEKINDDFEDIVSKLDDLAMESPSIKDKLYYIAVSEFEADNK